jgi:uncharacterized membrane protein
MSPGAIPARFAVDRNANLEEFPMKRLILALVIGLFAASTAQAGGRGGIGGDVRSAAPAPSGDHHSSGGQQGGGVTPDGAKPGIGSGSN